MRRVLILVGVAALVAPAFPLPAPLASGSAAAQTDAGPGSGGEAFTLQPAFPNPFEERTRIPFILGAELFESEDEAVVTIRVFNLLHQVVAVPGLADGDGGEGPPLSGRTFRRPGSYEAVWDGRDEAGEPLRPGPYFVELDVNGRTQVRKLLLSREATEAEQEGPGARRTGAGRTPAPTAPLGSVQVVEEPTAVLAHVDLRVALGLRGPGGGHGHEAAVTGALEHRDDRSHVLADERPVTSADGEFEPLLELVDLVAEDLDGLVDLHGEHVGFDVSERFLAQGRLLAPQVLDLQQEL